MPWSAVYRDGRMGMGMGIEPVCVLIGGGGGGDRLTCGGV